jgi:hypothetical protein
LIFFSYFSLFHCRNYLRLLTDLTSLLPPLDRLPSSSRLVYMFFSGRRDSLLLTLDFKRSISLVRVSHWPLRFLLNLSRKSLSTRDCSRSLRVLSSSALRRSVSRMTFLSFSSLISKHWLALRSTTRCRSYAFYRSSLRTVSSRCSRREWLISPELLV